MAEQSSLFALVLGGGSPRATATIPEEVLVGLKQRRWQWRGGVYGMAKAIRPPVNGYIIGIYDSSRAEDVIEMVRHAVAHIGRSIPPDEDEDGD